MVNWKTIPNTNNVYKISDEGVVYSNRLKRTIKVFLYKDTRTVGLRMKCGRRKTYSLSKLDTFVKGNENLLMDIVGSGHKN